MLVVLIIRFIITKYKKPPKRLHNTYAWLGIKNLFQTFEELDQIRDKQADIRIIRQLLAEDGRGDKEVAKLR